MGVVAWASKYNGFPDSSPIAVIIFGLSTSSEIKIQKLGIMK